MANGTTGTAQKDAKFLELLSQGATVGAAARGAGYARRSLYRWRKARADFAAAWDDALAEGTDLLEDEALRRRRMGSMSRASTRGRSAATCGATRTRYSFSC
jgi:transposase-like protein